MGRTPGFGFTIWLVLAIPFVKLYKWIISVLGKMTGAFKRYDNNS